MSSGPLARRAVARSYAIIEDAVYIGLGILLAAVVIALLVSAFISFGKSLLAGTFLSGSVVGLLDQILLVLLIVELLYTVQVSFREHTLVPEPFLLVGMISAIRRVLVLTAELGAKHEKVESVSTGFVLELAVLAGMVLALALSLMLLRRRGLAEMKSK